MTLGNMLELGLALAFVAGPLSSSAMAQSTRITCLGILIDVDTRPRAEWPLAVIYDHEGHYNVHD
jgi:hypothetical protein